MIWGKPKPKPDGEPEPPRECLRCGKVKPDVRIGPGPRIPLCHECWGHMPPTWGTLAEGD